MESKIYLSVSFKEKDIAKNLGCRWDPNEKKWYIDNSHKNKDIVLEKWNVFEEIKELIGEDVKYGGNLLEVDLIPSSSWYKNVRSSISQSEWDRIRFFVYKRADYKCEFCGYDTKSPLSERKLHAHERWEYKTHSGESIQKLMRIMAVCELCDSVVHMGLSQIKGRDREAREQLKRIRNFSNTECAKHIDNAFSLYEERSRIKWKLDIGLITRSILKKMDILPDMIVKHLLLGYLPE